MTEFRFQIRALGRDFTELVYMGNF